MYIFVDKLIYNFKLKVYLFINWFLVKENIVSDMRMEYSFFIIFKGSFYIIGGFFVWYDIVIVFSGIYVIYCFYWEIVNLYYLGIYFGV